MPRTAREGPRVTRQLHRPIGLIAQRGQVLPATAGESLTAGAVEIVPVAAKREGFDLDPALGHPFLGYVIRLNGVTIHHAGDTIPYVGLVETLAPLAIDLAFLPTNGRDSFRTRAGTIGNLDYREAAELAAALGVDTVVPVHWGMFAGNTGPPGHFVSYLAERYPVIGAHLLARYGRFIYQRP